MSSCAWLENQTSFPRSVASVRSYCPGDQKGKNTHIVTYIPASTSLTLPIPLGTGFCNASLALSVGRGGR